MLCDRCVIELIEKMNRAKAARDTKNGSDRVICQKGIQVGEPLIISARHIAVHTENVLAHYCIQPNFFYDLHALPNNSGAGRTTGRTGKTNSVARFQCWWFDGREITKDHFQLS